MSLKMKVLIFFILFVIIPIILLLIMTIFKYRKSIYQYLVIKITQPYVAIPSFTFHKEDLNTDESTESDIFIH